MTSRARAARQAVHYLPDSSTADHNDLDHRVTCQWCDRPYLVVGTGWDRRIQPDHLPTCRWHRPPAASTAPGAPRSATQVPEVPEAHQSATSQPTSAQAIAGGGAP